MHLTPSAPVSIPDMLPEVADLARTTVRLHPRRGTPTAEQSSMGGPLLWPVDDPWPTCDGPLGGDHSDSSPGAAEAPLVPVLQLFGDDFPEIPFPEGTDLLQVLWCPFDHDPWCSPRPQLRWRARADISQRLSTMPAPDGEAEAALIPRPCTVSPERVVEYPSADLPREVWLSVRDKIDQIKQESGWDYDADLAVASGSKVGGYPGWTQVPDWPRCACGAVMDHLSTVASWEFSRGDEKRWIALADRASMAGWGFASSDDHPWRALQNPTGLMLGDVGGIYLFVCTVCPDRPFDYRFDCS